MRSKGFLSFYLFFKKLHSENPTQDTIKHACGRNVKYLMTKEIPLEIVFTLLMQLMTP